MSCCWKLFNPLKQELFQYFDQNFGHSNNLRNLRGKHQFYLGRRRLLQRLVQYNHRLAPETYQNCILCILYLYLYLCLYLVVNIFPPDQLKDICHCFGTGKNERKGQLYLSSHPEIFLSAYNKIFAGLQFSVHSLVHFVSIRSNKFLLLVKYRFQGTFYCPKSSKKCVCILFTFYSQ